MKIPDAIAHYLITIASTAQVIAYLEVSPDGYLRSWGGNLDSYDLHNLSLGEHASKHLQAIHGFFPLPAEPEVLPYIQLKLGLIVDIHLFTEQISDNQISDNQITGGQISGEYLPKSNTTESAISTADNSGWILLIDTTDKAKKQQILQQKGNDLRLRHHQQTKRHATNSSLYKTYPQSSNLGIASRHPLQKITDIALLTLY
ncbi:MAG: hypothetical protein AAFR58_11415 [Cyanobacteria bacterium J06627_28]